MSNLFNTLKPAEASGKTAKTDKITAITSSKNVAGSDFKQDHHFAGAGNELASVKHSVSDAGVVTDSKTAFYNGSQNVSQRKGIATPAVVGGSTGTPLTGFTAETSADSISITGTETATLSGTTPVPATATIGAITWVSGTPAVASVSGSIVTPLTIGTTVLTGTETATGTTSTVSVDVKA